MKVIHIESGLGNQMLSYCEYLAMQKMNPTDKVYIETIIFEIPECNEVICQWNGYELENIFSIKAPNIRELFSAEEWAIIISEIRETRFWEKNWNYPVHITNVLNRHGLQLVNIRGDFENDGSVKICPNDTTSIKSRIRDSVIVTTVKRIMHRWHEEEYLKRFFNYDNIFITSDKNLYTGQWLSLFRRGNGLEKIDSEIRTSFEFPDYSDSQNASFSEYLDNINAIALHVRRGDALADNAWIYRSGYFKRAIKYIRRNVESPVFVFVTDPKSVEWCKEKSKSIFGLDIAKDKIHFVDWNKGANSFRDMQLMTHCKHAIISNSSFGWFGAYLIPNPNKITISPLLEIETTHHF